MPHINMTANNIPPQHISTQPPALTLHTHRHSLTHAQLPHLGFMSPIALASLAKSDTGRRCPLALTGRLDTGRSRLFMSLSRSSTHTSRSSSQCARRITYVYVRVCACVCMCVCVCKREREREREREGVCTTL